MFTIPPPKVSKASDRIFKAAAKNFGPGLVQLSVTRSEAANCTLGGVLLLVSSSRANLERLDVGSTIFMRKVSYGGRFSPSAIFSTMDKAAATQILNALCEPDGTSVAPKTPAGSATNAAAASVDDAPVAATSAALVLTTTNKKLEHLRI